LSHRPQAEQSTRVQSIALCKHVGRYTSCPRLVAPVVHILLLTHSHVLPSLLSACLLLLLRVRAGGGLISPSRLDGFMLVAARLGGGLISICSLLLAVPPRVRAAAPAVGAVCGVPGSASRLMGLRFGVQSRALGPARGGSSARGTLTSPEGPACSRIEQEVAYN
jgi:hypothetical protein